MEHLGQTPPQDALITPPPARVETHAVFRLVTPNRIHAKGEVWNAGNHKDQMQATWGVGDFLDMVDLSRWDGQSWPFQYEFDEDIIGSIQKMMEENTPNQILSIYKAQDITYSFEKSKKLSFSILNLS